MVRSFESKVSLVKKDWMDSGATEVIIRIRLSLEIQPKDALNEVSPLVKMNRSSIAGFSVVLSDKRRDLPGLSQEACCEVICLQAVHVSSRSVPAVRAAVTDGLRLGRVLGLCHATREPFLICVTALLRHHHDE